MDNTSYWHLTAERETYPSLDESIVTDVLIIGGGITGITCAYCLARAGAKPVVIEAGALCGGTTGNTTGKVTIQHGIIYSNIAKNYGADAARQYAQSQSSALEFVRKRVREESISCQLADNTAYVYASSAEDLEVLKNEHEAATAAGIDAELYSDPGFPGGSCGKLGFRNQAVFHPVRYVDALAGAALAKGARIYCGTKAVKVEDGEDKTVHCENGMTIKARHVVMATQYPIYDGPNLFFTRLYAKRTYGIAVRAKRGWPDGSYISNSQPTRSVRTHRENGESVLIVVGEGHPTGRGGENMETHYANLVQFADEIAGVDTLLARWSAQDYETPDQIPYIGRISDHSNFYVASGFGKWGLTNGTLAGMMISGLIADGSCLYEGLYSRTRADYTSSPGKTAYGVLSPVVELIKSKFKGTEGLAGLKRGEGRVINFEGRKAGIYRDYEDNATILDISCTHMSTELIFNAAEKTWDCPAHGGRFNTDGALLEGPPKDPLKIYFRGRFSDLTEDG